LRLTVRDVCVTAVMTALCVSTSYAMIGLANVKLMDLLVFVSGFGFGPLVGGLVGVLSWCVYGTLNPLGFSLPVLVATSLGEALYGVVGGLLRGVGFRVPGLSSIGRLEHWASNLKVGLLGFLLTFVYDAFTNFVFALSTGEPVLYTFARGVPFAAMHQASNFAFFFWGGTALIMVIQRLPSVWVWPAVEKPATVRRTWKWISAALLCLLVTASSFAAYYREESLRLRGIYENTLQDLEAVSICVSVLIDYGNGTREWHNDTRLPLGSSALNATLAAADVDYTVGQYGAFVSAINGLGIAGDMWWSLWRWSPTSSGWEFILETCDRLALRNGDRVAWYYSSGFPPPPPP